MTGPKAGDLDSSLQVGRDALLRLAKTAGVREAIEQAAVSRVNKQAPAKRSSNAAVGNKRSRPRKRPRVWSSDDDNDEYELRNWSDIDDHLSKQGSQRPVRRSARIHKLPKLNIVVPTKSGQSDQLSTDENTAVSSPKSDVTLNNSGVQESARLLAVGALSLINNAVPVDAPGLPMAKSVQVEEALVSSPQTTSISSILVDETERMTSEDAGNWLDVLVHQQGEDDFFTVPTNEVQATSQTTAPSLFSFSPSSEFADHLLLQSEQRLPEVMRPTYDIPTVQTPSLPPFSTFHQFSSLTPPRPQSRPLLPGPPFPIPVTLQQNLEPLTNTFSQPEVHHPLPGQTVQLPSFAELVASINTLQSPPWIVHDLDNTSDSIVTHNPRAQTSSSASLFPAGFAESINHRIQTLAVEASLYGTHSQAWQSTRTYYDYHI